MKTRGIGLFLVFVTLGAAPVPAGALSGALAAEPSALRLGYCASDFDVCYNACRISNPGMSFSDDRARVACGQTCLQQRSRCEGRAGAVPAPHRPAPPRMAAPTPAAPPIEAPRLAQPRSLSVQQAPAATAGDSPSAAPASSPSSGQPAARAEPQKKESGIWGWIKPRERKDSVIPGKF